MVFKCGHSERTFSANSKAANVAPSPVINNYKYPPQFREHLD